MLSAHAAMQALLARRMPEVRFDGVGLGDCVEFLRDVSGERIYVDWATLDVRSSTSFAAYQPSSSCSHAGVPLSPRR